MRNMVLTRNQAVHTGTDGGRTEPFNTFNRFLLVPNKRLRAETGVGQGCQRKLIEMALSRGGVQCRECPVFYPSEEEVRLSSMEVPASPGFAVVLQVRRRDPTSFDGRP